MWFCPDCQQSFKNKNQSHSCESTSIDSHIEKSISEVKDCFNLLRKHILTFQETSESITPSAILYSVNSTFLAIKPKKNWLDIEFVLPTLYDEFPIHKTVKASKNRYAHFIRIETIDEIDEQLLKWLNDAYKANKNY